MQWDRTQELLADAGYFTEKNVTVLEQRNIEAYIPPDQQKHGATVEPAPRGRIPAGLPGKEVTIECLAVTVV
ncbi:MAG TPA: hypothetical protein GX721_05030 [Firmicutes bacterium]|nr:hypothetical protein [Bacillota bacterium]